MSARAAGWFAADPDSMEAHVAELSPLEEKLAEVIGLAQASQQVTGKVAKLPEADDDTQRLRARPRDRAEAA